VPAYTEARIQQLCAAALAAETPTYIDRIDRELRAALEEHIRLAKDSLGTHALNIALIEAVAARPSATSDP
jgi:hypothetical protein